MKQYSVLSRAIQISLFASISHSAIAADEVEVENEQAASVERIQVTGSRIQRQDMETASPVAVINSQTIRTEGYTSVDEILQSQPSMAGAALGATSNNGSGGSAQVDLRGMGANRTLVLLNGRRMVSSGTGADSAVDLNTIPVAMIQRVEILKDGASAVYGSDAIAGVVNIITRKDFEGLQVDLNGSISSESDAENLELSGLYGFNTDTGNYTFGLSYTDRKGAMQGDRDWVPAGSSSFVPEGSLGGKVKDKDGNWVARTEGYDYTQDSWLQTPSKKYSFFANMVNELDNEITLTGDLLYTRRESEQMMAPQPASVMLDVCGEENVDPAKCITLDQKMTDGGIEPNNGQIEYRQRMTNAGSRISQQETDTVRASLGLAGLIDVHTGITWDLSYTYGRNDATSKVYNSINAVNMENSIYENQQDWFYGDNSAHINDVSYTQVADGGNDQHLVSAVISGEAFDLDAGAVGYAIGAEYRRDSGFFTPDEIVQRGEGSSAQQDPTKGSYDVISVYQELSIPFSEKLTGEFALRFDDYSTFGNASTWKMGLTYAATDELMLRTVAATGFRAPNVSELFGGNVGSFDYLDDPWGNEEDPQILVNYTSDADLTAEESTSYTAGFVYSPEAIEGLSLTLDWWKFNIDNAIARMDVQVGLNQCFAGDVAACETFNITPDGNLNNLTSPLTNVGYQDTSGIDMNIQYQFEALGLDWRINNDTTHLIKFEQDDVDYTGTISGNYGGYAEYKNNFNIVAKAENWSVSYSNRYLGEMTNLLNDEKAESVLYHNVAATYFLSDEFKATLGIKNLTDEKPVSIYQGNDAGTVPEVYDTIGRQFYMGVTYKM
ncbi:TonB-dependent receptor [Shewanella sp. 202IG2-18]|uniref:TonB-dependent receptor plug domain-containing protein n=1 Tax=Parashewanella hymeniacidonis TaxID=2807618 RepID=UPI00195FCC37|nr:TonB-dependent receptor [Parashewanella hymeniacidonis]MBM7072533.1 TonB-dependent receptor [Parashewanella hymeniacidonis]